MGKEKDPYLLRGFIAMEMKVTLEIVASNPIHFAFIHETLGYYVQVQIRVL
jgi:hypothetical protein